jgi:CDP-diglyceride synthetase
MPDDTDDFDIFGEHGFDEPDPDDLGAEEDLPTYHSGRVRIIGAEPAGDTVREVTGPVEPHPDLPHWKDPATGQVPAVLDRSTGEEPALAPPTWREEDKDWEVHEELFQPAMLSEDLPAVGALIGESEEVDVERQPWHFESDDTLVIVPEEEEPTPEPAAAAPDEAEAEFEPVGVGRGASAAAGATSVVSPPPPAPTKTRSRASRTLGSRARKEPKARKERKERTERTDKTSTAGTGGRDMRVAIGSGVLLGIVALLCFAAGTVATMLIVTAVVLLATAEAYAAFRRAQYHPATLLGLIAVLSLMIETYNKGVAALPLVLVLLVAGSFVWYLFRVEPAAEPVSGLSSTMFVFVWVGAFGSFAALLLNPNLFPNRHGIAFILAAVIVTVADDVAALLVGSALGRHPLAPTISPNKSWEGLIGGAVAAILISVVVVHFIHPWTAGKALIYGVVVAIVAPLGDLSQSMIKRHLGVKDMGRLLPGHGGILDRVDGLLFVIPATYFVVKALHLG